MSLNASAPAKIILFGEHAVVHGHPAIAVPVSTLRATATAQPGGDGLVIEAVDLGERLSIPPDSDKSDHPLVMVVHKILQTLDVPPPAATITLRSTIPIAGGLGSGAAVSTCLARTLMQLTGKSLTLSALNALIFEIETIFAGTPSGIDNTVIVYEQPVYFVRGKPPKTITIGQPFKLVVADTGIAAPTHIPVGDVRTLRAADPQRIEPILQAIGDLVRRARVAVESGDVAALGPLMTQNHAYLRELTVSSLLLDQLVDAALAAGALGAKLSGAGRGGNMIALVRPEGAYAVESALSSAGAVHVFHTTVR